MKITATVNDYDAIPPGPPPADYQVCPGRAAAHCPCFYDRAEPIIVVPLRCCACMQSALTSVRKVA